MIKAVLFDVDGVLIDSLEANYQFYKSLLTKAGYKFPTRKEYPNYFHNSLYKNCEVLTNGSKEEIERVFKIGLEMEYPFDVIKLHKGARKTIQELGKKYKLGIVTNRLKKRFFLIPDLRDLKKLFSVVIAFEDTKNHKPHPEPLLVACRKLGVKPNEVVYVGDAETDIIAGKEAGTKTILYKEYLLSNPDFHIKALRDLIELLEELD
jgi:HAD superfamily hydrolase (TIGR01509 family)